MVRDQYRCDEKKRMERSLARLAAIVESSDDAILSKDFNGIIQTWNAGAERLFGYRAEEVVGRPITLLLPPERTDEEQQIMERVRSGEHVEHVETVRVTKEGRRIDVSVTISPSRTKTAGSSRHQRSPTTSPTASRQRQRCWTPRPPPRPPTWRRASSWPI